MGNNWREAVTAVMAAVIMLILIVAGCTPPTPTQPNEKLTAAEATSPVPDDRGKWVEIGTIQIGNENESPDKIKTQAAITAKQLAKNFYEFDKAAYDSALKEGRIVFLDFYANWCPICKAEEPEIKAAFNELDAELGAADAEKVVGFRVNYNDDQTDADEKALAKKFGIAYQHTKIVITPDEKVLSRSLEQSGKQEIIDQIKSSIATTAAAK